MANALKFVPQSTIITGWDFSTSGVKCLAFDVDGNTLADVRLPTDLWTKGGVSELSVVQLEGQARGSVRAIATALRSLGRLDDWRAGGISATHHTSGRIDARTTGFAGRFAGTTRASPSSTRKDSNGSAVRTRCAKSVVHGPSAIASATFVKDEKTLDERTTPHRENPVARVAGRGLSTGNFGTSVVGGVDGIMDFRTGQWCKGMLDAIDCPILREYAWKQLPRIIDHFEPVGQLHAGLTEEAGLAPAHVPLVFPTSDDQQAGLIGGGAVDAGQMAIILGTSAVVNSSSSQLPATDELDAMRLNWGPYLWMRCYNNGASFLNEVVGENPDWIGLEAEACGVEPARKARW